MLHVSALWLSKEDSGYRILQGDHALVHKLCSSSLGDLLAGHGHAEAMGNCVRANSKARRQLS